MATSIKNYFYPAETIERVVQDAGFSFEVLDDWDDDIPEAERVPDEIMVRLTV